MSELLRLLELEKLEDNIFRGESRDIGSAQVYGGQVLGQALRAAYETVDPLRRAHSLHAYFLRRGDFNAPIVYFVDRSRDGHSFTNRRVTAIQHGEQIFHMAASFQVREPGVEHQFAMPGVPPPEALPDATAMMRTATAMPPDRARAYASWQRPFEFRPIDSPPTAASESPRRQMWLRAVDRVDEEEPIHQCLLAYVSDFYLIGTASAPYAGGAEAPRLVRASIDHAMWFHRPLRVDEWLLYSVDSPSASGARGFARGSLFSRMGELVASTAQEGLMRAVSA